jgi:predicted  nucleic acid-binding Zn-ribbon protein
MSKLSKFTGLECAACCEVFADGDDVVVCPECGTPHHRSCYAENGECVNAESHGRMQVIESALDTIRLSEIQVRRKFDEFEEVRVAAEVDRESKEFSERSIYGASKAELCAYMQIEPGSAEYENRLTRIKMIDFNVFAGLLLPLYQFYKGMKTWGFMLMFMSFILPVTLPLIMGLMLLFHDYLYLRSSAFKIKVLRHFYEGLPPDSQNLIEYYDFLKLKGKPSVLAGIANSMFALLLLLLLVHHFGLEPLSIPSGG